MATNEIESIGIAIGIIGAIIFIVIVIVAVFKKESTEEEDF